MQYETLREKYRRKEVQAWELASLAWQDGDDVDAAKHTQKAKEYRELANSCE